LEELGGLDSSQAGERGLRLLLVLAFVFPAHFMYSVRRYCPSQRNSLNNSPLWPRRKSSRDSSLT
jgi:hypothetical protein